MKSNELLKKLFVFLFFANLIAIFGLWWNGSGSLIQNGNASGIFIALGRITGLIAEYLILTQLILIGRIQPIERLYGFDKLNRLHRLNGKCIAVILICHPLLLLTGYSIVNKTNAWVQFLTFFMEWEDVWKAVIGLIILLSAVGISLAIIRKRLNYEKWHFTHLFIYVAIFLFFGHQTNTADVSFGAPYYYWLILNFTVFGLLLLFRFLKPFYLFHKHKFYVEKIVQETDDTISLYIKGKNMHEFQHKAGQFLINIFLHKKFWYPHPFSISSAHNGEYIRLSVKNSGDFTSTLPSLPPCTKIMVEGPLGIFTALPNVSKYLFIAGGIGITPIRAMIEELSKQNQGGEKKDMILLYANRDEKHIVFKNELETFPVNITHFLSAEEPKNQNMVKGFINLEAIKKYSPDFLEREIYICGPPPMMDAIIKTLLEAGASKKQLHFEKFEFS